MIIGIDPGLTGALVAIDGDQKIIGYQLMPTYQVGKSKHVEALGVFTWLDRIIPAGEMPAIWIEQVASRPGQGVASMFTFGRAVGTVEAVATLLGRMSHVAPHAWKTAAGIPTGATKDASRGRALELGYSRAIPELAQKAKGQALADALLIARYGLSKAVD